MKLFRRIISLVCIITASATNAGEQPAASAKCAANPPITAELQPLQGTWEGVMVGQEKDGRITITISSNSLHFHRDTNFWFETTIALPAGKVPPQLHATIKNSAPPTNSLGQVVRALYKVETEKLTLVALGGDEEETPKSFEAAEEKGLSRYELRKVQPQKKNIEPLKTK